MKTTFLTFLFSLIIASACAQEAKVVTAEIHVDGICSMCKERIENAVDVKGVKSAEWTVSNHHHTISYRTDKITEEEIHRLLNEAGHDTEKSKASDEAYNSIHACCRYREMTDH